MKLHLHFSEKYLQVPKGPSSYNSATDPQFLAIVKPVSRALTPGLQELLAEAQENAKHMILRHSLFPLDRFKSGQIVPPNALATICSPAVSKSREQKARCKGLIAGGTGSGSASLIVGFLLYIVSNVCRQVHGKREP